MIDPDAIIVYREHRCPELGPCAKCNPSQFKRIRDKEIKALTGYSRIGRNNV